MGREAWRKADQNQAGTPDRQPDLQQVQFTHAKRIA
jgi:hypothetical protein